MFSIALSSLRLRTGAFAASFVNVFLGAAILMSFASLLDSAGGAGVSSTDKNTLTTMAYVIGGWGLVIVAFGIAATANLTVRQRNTEIALLKSAGATPKQIGRMIISEVAVVSALAAVIAVPVAFFTGRAALASLGATNQVARGISYHFGIFALSVGLGDTLVAAAIAAIIAARRAASLSTREALASAATGGRQKLGRKRIVFGVLSLVAGADCAVLTATVMKNQGFATMSIAGEAIIWTSIGFALFAPVLIRVTARLIGRPLRVFSGVTAYLADTNVKQRTDQSAGVLMPVILFTGMASGSLYLETILNNTNAAQHLVQSADDKGVETLNFIVVAMIAVFAAVVLINIAIATTIYRRREFGQQRLIGSAPPEVVRMVGFETVITVITGLVFGTIAALAGVVPYNIARAHKAVPSVSLGVYFGVIATVVVLTFAANLGATRRAIRRPALDAVAVNA